MWAPFSAPAWRPITGSFTFGADGMLRVGRHRPDRRTARDSTSGTARRTSTTARQCPAVPFVQRLRERPAAALPHDRLERQQRSAHLRPRGADARLSRSTCKWDITENLHTQLRRAVHQGEDQQLRHPGRGQQRRAGATTRPNGDGTPQIALSPAPEHQLRRRLPRQSA